jgi:hypothetical protein
MIATKAAVDWAVVDKSQLESVISNPLSQELNAIAQILRTNLSCDHQLEVGALENADPN